jgi:hypothetical protein
MRPGQTSGLSEQNAGYVSMEMIDAQHSCAAVLAAAHSQKGFAHAPCDHETIVE